MSDSDDLDDWELLPCPDVAPCLTPTSPFQETDDHTARINPDYFALHSGDRVVRRVASGESLAGSVEDSDGFRSDGRSSSSPDEEKGGIFRGEHSELDVDFQGHRNSNLGDVLNKGTEREEEEEPHEMELAEPVRMENGTEEPESEVSSEAGRGNSDEDATLIQAASSGETEEIGGGDQLGSVAGESSAVTEDGDGSSVGASEGVVTSENVSRCEGEKTVAVWMKLPLDLLKLCVSRVRPVWAITIAAGIVGILMLGKRLYKMKRKSRSIPLKASMDDKKASQLIVRAARLNEAFSVVRRVPVIRLPPPAGGLTLLPASGSIRALDW